jgi:hypothetical protein
LLASGLALSVRVTAESPDRTRMLIRAASSDGSCAGQPAQLPINEELAVPLTYSGILRPSDVVGASVVGRGSGCHGAGLDTVVVFARRGELWPPQSDGGGLFSSCA